MRTLLKTELFCASTRLYDDILKKKFFFLISEFLFKKKSLINKLKPGSVKKITKTGGGFALRENVSQFCSAAKAYGVPDNELFQTDDLFEKKNIAQVTMTIHALGRYVRL